MRFNRSILISVGFDARSVWKRTSVVKPSVGLRIRTEYAQDSKTKTGRMCVLGLLVYRSSLARFQNVLSDDSDNEMRVLSLLLVAACTLGQDHVMLRPLAHISSGP